MTTHLPTLQTIKSFNIMGLQIRTKNSLEFEPETAQIPSVWEQFYASSLEKDSGIFEVYSDYESDANGFYHVTLGVLAKDDNRLPNTKQITVHGGHYLVFTNQGPLPETVISTWKQIWQYFETNSLYQRAYRSDFEKYDSPDGVSIYIGVTGK